MRVYQQVNCVEVLISYRGWMPSHDTVGRVARLPNGIDYAPNGTPVLAYIPGAREVGPVEQQLTKRPHSPDATELDSALGDFVTATLLLDEARELVDRKAGEARQAGATWSQIGRRAGITPQSAQQRWSEDGNQRHNQRRRRRADTKKDTGGKVDG